MTTDVDVVDAVSDHELVRRVCELDDNAALSEILDRYADRMFRVALRILGDRHQAEDCTQESIVRAWRALHTWRGDAQLSTWLSRIVTNTALQMLRRRREQPTAEVPDHGSVALDPSRQIEDRARLTTIAAALQALTPEQRACLMLREQGELSYDELAATLEISVSAVKSRLFRARTELDAALADFEKVPA